MSVCLAKHVIGLRTVVAVEPRPSTVVSLGKNELKVVCHLTGLAGIEVVAHGIRHGGHQVTWCESLTARDGRQ